MSPAILGRDYKLAAGRVYRGLEQRQCERGGPGHPPSPPFKGKWPIYLSVPSGLHEHEVSGRSWSRNRDCYEPLAFVSQSPGQAEPTFCPLRSGPFSLGYQRGFCGGSGDMAWVDLSHGSVRLSPAHAVGRPGLLWLPKEQEPPRHERKLTDRAARDHQA